MIRLCFATNNKNKISEICQILGNEFRILSLIDIHCHQEIPENHPDLAGNSLQKARFIFDNYQTDCFADDTGLEVVALNGDPGVLSARYAGIQKDNNDNIKLLLNNLSNQTDRKARFKTVITLIQDNEVHQFEGVVNGEITKELRGHKGFGYDPVFIPEGHTRTFAELSPSEKNKISHRGIAIRKLARYLRGNKTPANE
jgi:XTP/dITP diphosphohydrolase